MFALFKLQIKVLFKNPFLIFDFLIAFIFILIFGSLIQNNASLALEAQKQVAMTSLFGFIVAMLLLNSGMYSFGFSFFSMKESVLLKRIGASKISKPGALSAFMLSGLTILCLVLIWTFSLTAILGVAGVIPQIAWADAKWGAVIVGIIIGGITSYILALFFVSISKNTEIYNMFTTLFFFFAVFLSGGLTGSDARWMEIISYLTPVGWNADFISNAFLGLPVWNLGGYTGNIMGMPMSVEAWEASLDLIMPIIFATVAGLATIKTFKWDS